MGVVDAELAVLYEAGEPPRLLRLGLSVTTGEIAEKLLDEWRPDLTVRMSESLLDSEERG